MEYVAVSTVRNEEKYIEYALKSLFNQTIKPKLCVIIDDGSIDRTPDILKEYPVIVIRKNDERYFLGSYNMQRALMLGVNKINELYPDWKYLFKFDADTYLNEKDYIERLLELIEKNNKCGICSGNIKNKKIWIGRASDGAKIYKRKCWDDIEGLSKIIHWDTHSMLKAYYKGWIVSCFRDIEYIELRTSERERLYEWYLTGITRYFLGFPLYHTMGVAFVYSLKSKIIGSLIMVLTHLIYRLMKLKRPFEKEYYNFVYKYSWFETKIRINVILNIIKHLKRCLI